MVQRCLDPSRRDYRNYGGRGITVCEQWKNFEEFEKWAVSSGWQRELQIDRKDNSLGYSPENCHWVTSRRNNRNRRNNKLTVEKVSEIRKMLADKISGPRIAQKFGVHHSLIYRIKLGQQWL